MPYLTGYFWLRQARNNEWKSVFGVRKMKFKESMPVVIAIKYTAHQHHWRGMASLSTLIRWCNPLNETTKYRLNQILSLSKVWVTRQKAKNWGFREWREENYLMTVVRKISRVRKEVMKVMRKLCSLNNWVDILMFKRKIDHLIEHIWILVKLYYFHIKRRFLIRTGKIK